MLLKNYSKRAVITGTAIILFVKFIIRPYVMFLLLHNSLLM